MSSKHNNFHCYDFIYLKEKKDGWMYNVVIEKKMNVGCYNRQVHKSTLLLLALSVFNYYHHYLMFDDY